MTSDVPEKDLVVLVADKQMEYAVKGLLTRGPSLGFQNLSQDIYVHMHRDPGCFLRGDEFLRPFHRQYRHAIVMFDHRGSGREGRLREDLEADLERRLFSSGWEDRAAAIVLDPELEVWVWSDSPEVDAVLGWRGRTPTLPAWLQAEGYSTGRRTKPSRPKEAMECALRAVGKSRSAAIFLQLAERVSVDRCTDPTFLKFKTTLRQWFGDTTVARDGPILGLETGPRRA